MNASEVQPPSLVLPGTRTGRDPERSIRRGPRRTSAEAVAATQRDRLIDALVRTVAQSGYACARVSDICQAAGVTRPVFYEVFQGKEDAFLAAHRHGTSLVVQAMGAAFQQAPDWPEGVRDALAALLGILAGAPAFATMAVVELDALGQAGRQERERLLGEFRRFFAQVPHTPAVVPAAELVDVTVGGVYAGIYRHVDAGRTADLPELLPTLTYYVLAPFLGRDGAARTAASAPAASGPMPCRK